MSLCPLETNQDEQGDKPGTCELLAVHWLLEKLYESSSRGAKLLYPRQQVSQQLWHRHRETEGRRGESAVLVTCPVAIIKCPDINKGEGSFWFTVPKYHSPWWGRHGGRSCGGRPHCIQSQVAERDVASGSSLQFWIPAYEMVPPTATVALPNSMNLF